MPYMVVLTEPALIDVQPPLTFDRETVEMLLGICNGSMFDLFETGIEVSIP